MKFTKDITENLNKYYELIKNLNQKLNLISKNEESIFFDKHIVDSIEISKLINPKQEQKLIDLGSGGGVPGIPIAIEYPQIDIVLLDSTNKKIEALNQIITELDLKNTKTACGRIEELAHEKNFRESFDFVTAKALAELPTLLEYSIPFLKIGGQLFAYKGPNYEEEITKSENALKILNSKIIKIHKYELTNNLGSRAIIVIEKTAKTLGIYPRITGIPLKKPL